MTLGARGEAWRTPGAQGVHTRRTGLGLVYLARMRQFTKRNHEVVACAMIIHRLHVNPQEQKLQRKNFHDGDGVEMGWRCGGHEVQMVWRWCGDGVKMGWRCGGDGLEMWWRCAGDGVAMR